jgi:hypothetical protein
VPHNGFGKNGYGKSATKMQYSCTDEIRCSNKNKITISKKVADVWREGRRDLKRLLNIPLKNCKKNTISEEIY